jgi:hypothetical protein
MPWWVWTVIGVIIGAILVYGYFLSVFSRMRW